MSELMYEAQKFINAEDAFEARDEFPNRKRKESKDRRFESSRSFQARIPKGRKEECRLFQPTRGTTQELYATEHVHRLGSIADTG